MAKWSDEDIAKAAAFWQVKGMKPEDIAEFKGLLRGDKDNQTRGKAIAETSKILGAQDVMAMDSAPDIYRAALTKSGIDVRGCSAAGVELTWRAFQRKAAAGRRPLAMDKATIAATTDPSQAAQDLAARFPHLKGGR